MSLLRHLNINFKPGENLQTKQEGGWRLLKTTSCSIEVETMSLVRQMNNWSVETPSWPLVCYPDSVSKPCVDMPIRMGKDRDDHKFKLCSSIFPNVLFRLVIKGATIGGHVHNASWISRYRTCNNCGKGVPLVASGLVNSTGNSALNNWPFQLSNKTPRAPLSPAEHPVNHARTKYASPRHFVYFVSRCERLDLHRELNSADLLTKVLK